MQVFNAGAFSIVENDRPYHTGYHHTGIYLAVKRAVTFLPTHRHKSGTHLRIFHSRAVPLRGALFHEATRVRLRRSTCNRVPIRLPPQQTLFD
jgi:hypothetical protein